MSGRAIDFLEDWVHKNVTNGDRKGSRGRAMELAELSNEVTDCHCADCLPGHSCFCKAKRSSILRGCNDFKSLMYPSELDGLFWLKGIKVASLPKKPPTVDTWSGKYTLQREVSVGDLPARPALRPSTPFSPL